MREKAFAFCSEVTLQFAKVTPSVCENYNGILRKLHGTFAKVP
jgi:hypothetical protein